MILLPFEKGLGGVLARLGRSSWSDVGRKWVPPLTSAGLGTICLCIDNWEWISLPFLKDLGRVPARLGGIVIICLYSWDVHQGGV